MAMSRFYCVTILLLFVHLCPTILAWGDEGHYATCKIAEGFLTEAAKDAVRKLLPESAAGELAAVCSWPDLPEIRIGYPWSRELHFANTPDLKCTYDYCRDCHDSTNQKNRCVVGGIYNYTQQLVTGYNHYEVETKHNLTEALMFLSHFMGDLHQPLHLGFRGDLGGNRVIVSWFNELANLHRVWDDRIIERALEKFYGSSLTNMIDAITRNLTDEWSNEHKIWQACHHSACPNEYASESISLACEYGYKDATNGSQLHDGYFLSRLPIVEKRLVQGGMRLAAILNRIFGMTNETLKLPYRLRSLMLATSESVARCSPAANAN